MPDSGPGVTHERIEGTDHAVARRLEFADQRRLEARLKTELDARRTPGAAEHQRGAAIASAKSWPQRTWRVNIAAWVCGSPSPPKCRRP